MSSFKAVVRALMEPTGWTYQQIWNALKKLGNLPEELSAEKGWTLATCRALYAQHGFEDVDFREAQVVEKAMCQECGEDFPYADAHPYDRATRGAGRMEPPQFCFRCRAANGVHDCYGGCGGRQVLGSNQDLMCDQCRDEARYKMEHD
ncbi:hypothetical protein OWM54_14400 [Myxococcus sp. MISCRS1]|uniref:hypothetical protein n=1 Tax=Myxococcus sp. MISCRS1 TaxID=2996786 RepID=UPI00226E1D41|nr:hypothetical protein [Myxococcus sp. MISCRS1]MCY0998322.1 hypothetical protein [Myxococcus sp. MISCRS1]